MIKKFVLSTFVILSFGLYVFQQKVKFIQGDDPVPTVITSTSVPQTNIQNALYKDGTYTGSPADAYYGIIQVKAIISGGKITDVIFLQYPSDRRTSQEINSQAMPMLKQEVIAAQSANVDIISGATASSGAFRVSLQDALTQAKI